MKIFGTPDRGRIEINYYSREDLERIFELLVIEKKEETVIFEELEDTTQVG